MANKPQRDPTIAAIEAVYDALKDLDAVTQGKVLTSTYTLLGISEPSSITTAARQITGRPIVSSPAPTRPVSIVELMQEKKPGTNSQRIALFAYYREKYEGVSRFSRDELEPYFAKAKESQSTNYARDFVEAVRKGWIHEDGGDSYLTSKGVEAVESGFDGERKYNAVKRTKSTKKTGKRSAAKK